MHTAGKVIRGKYFDSVSLMLVAREMLGWELVRDAAAIMATDENKRILASSGMEWTGLAEATDTDLALGVKADTKEAADEALEKAEQRLSAKKKSANESGSFQPRSLERALEDNPEAHLALISIAGRYAAAEAKKALQAGLNVMLFSDNVSMDDERVCKEMAAEKGLLVMGPDCGTAIINGIPLGFANVVRRGAIGIVAAAGTGLQEVSSTIHNLGGGVSHALGTGGRDIKEEIGGRSFLAALAALKDDPDTRVIVLVSKTPAPSVLQKIGEAIATLDKPAVGIFIGADPDIVKQTGALAAATLEQAAHMAVALDKGLDPEAVIQSLNQRDRPATPALSGTQQYLRGLFCGGTFAQEAVALLTPRLGTINSNIQTPLAHPDRSAGHTIIDLGGDEFTAGRPHPMIDFSLRNRRILEEARDPETAVILLDVVLGYGSNAQPAEELGPVIREVCGMDDPPVVIFHVCGTDEDPQRRDHVIQTLAEAGGLHAESNAAAAIRAGMIAEQRSGAVAKGKGNE